MRRDLLSWNGWGWAAHQSALRQRDAFWRWLTEALAMPALLATPPRPLSGALLPPSRVPDKIAAALSAIVGPEQVRQGDRERAFHARGRAYRDLLALRAGDLSTAPGLVVYPRGEEDVLAVLKLAASVGSRVIPFGGGTGSGHELQAAPDRISLDLSEMDQVIAVDPVAGTATLEAGIAGPALERALGEKGLMLGHQPDDFEFSTLGGRIAGGCTAGGAADWLLSARLATSQGVLEAGEPADGLDLRPLLAGSRGRWGIITAARIQVKPVAPLFVRAFRFSDFSQGLAVLRAAIQDEIAHSLLRLFDESETGFLYQLLGETPRPDGSLLIAAFPAVEAEWRFDRLAKGHGAEALGERAGRAWCDHRFQEAYWRDALLDRGLGMERIETMAPWSDLPRLRLAATAALEQAMAVTAPVAGAHGLVFCRVDDLRSMGARLTVTSLFPRALEREKEQAEIIRDAGEMAMLRPSPAENPLSAALLHSLKQSLDPRAILND
jgi:alkyldihydroxyacetonephosphate synthase